MPWLVVTGMFTASGLRGSCCFLDFGVNTCRTPKTVEAVTVAVVFCELNVSDFAAAGCR
jgi:hypothetical protein